MMNRIARTVCQSYSPRTTTKKSQSDQRCGLPQARDPNRITSLILSPKAATKRVFASRSILSRFFNVR